MFNFIIAIWLGAILNFGFIKSSFVNAIFRYKSDLFLSGYCSDCCCYLLCGFTNFKLEMDGQNFAILLVFIGGFSSYFVNTLGVIISPDQIQNIAQTDVAEATDLLSLRFGLWTIFFVILPIFNYSGKTQIRKILPLLLKKYFQSLLHLPL